MAIGWSSPTRRATGQCTVSIWVLILSNALVFQLAYLRYSSPSSSLDVFMPTSLMQPTESSSYALDYPRGTAVALPSIRVNEEEDKKINREIYGGAGDKKHLGGFTDIDLHGISPATWKLMVSYFGVKSILDVGCGRGISTTWFALHGVEVLCVEGSHDAVSQSMLPDPATQVVEHDFSRGPWWPPRTVDAVWCVEFLEHVGRNFHKNYIPAFRKAALIFASHSTWGGWHHVEVHTPEWWIYKFESYGFRYSPELTEKVRKTASAENHAKNISMTGKPYNAQHVWTTMKVFINPAVAALPEHAHLFAEHGCYDAYKSRPGNPIHRECGTGPKGELESVLPKTFYPLELTEEMDKAWEDRVKQFIKEKA